jgi:DNA polymerase gamma 1
LGEWPAWYKDLTKPPTQLPPGEIDLSQKKLVTPLLLRLQWDERPLIISRAFKWLYRVPKSSIESSQWAKDKSIIGHGVPVNWEGTTATGDEALKEDESHYYFRIPHAGGDGKNVGNPLGRSFVKYLENGRLSSAPKGDDIVSAEIARDATQMNVLCSYWSSARERIMDQMVVYDSPKSGFILPQMITMGTVTRRAVESTWLTASNAKKNRVGSELKAMVKAPPGYAIVGADVDSEELWISSVMGDSQFGMHGATAIGWMTLEGTKSAGTDLHSKTGSILGTSRDAAKVFNYSRIYGAGIKHAVQLLMQGDSKLTKEEAQEKAKALYAATKGEKSHRDKRLGPAARPSLWHGGTESYLFNMLESIARNDRPTTPALGCGVTKALSRSYLENENTYMPSRINWVVQSSGVDYLHLLIVAMSYLLKKYNINARYLISVHDELRYLSKEEDKYRTALALQIANAWTRALFCYNLGMDDVPQGVTFFSAVDIDHVLRKEVNMPCITPSNPTEIPSGVSLDIEELLRKLDNGMLGPATDYEVPIVDGADDAAFSPVSIVDIDSMAHYQFLRAQAERSGMRARLWLNRQSEDGPQAMKVKVRKAANGASFVRPSESEMGHADEIV